MAKPKSTKRAATKKTVTPAARLAKKAAAKRTAVKTSKAGKPAANGNRGLIIFGAVLAVVIFFAVVGKLRQGPPVKYLPVQVLTTYALAGNETSPLSSPRGIAVDGAGAVYVADMGNNRVVKFKPEGTFDSIWGAAGTNAGQFKEPSGVAVDGLGSVFVADAWNGRIQKFNLKGEYLGEIPAKSGNFYSPRNVAADGTGFIYVADTGNSCVKKFDADANLVKRWGEFGPGHNRFQETFGIAAGKDGLVYVGDAGNRRVKVFTAEGKFVLEIRVKGWKSGVAWPMVAVDGAGHIFATDVQNQMIWIYDHNGKYIGSWGNQPGKEHFAAPMGIATDSQGNVYVCNMNQGQILKLAGIKP